MKPLQLTKSMQSAKLNWRQILFAGLLIGSLFCSPVVTLFAGILFALTLGNPFPVWSKKASKKLLQYCVDGLGFGMNFHESLAAGREGMTFTVVSVVTVMIVGVVLGRLLRIDRKNSYLISSGTAICGGSAIAAVAPVIDADENQTSLSLATIFILNAVALFVFPVIGHWLGMGQTQFGTWAAIAIHDTSSVVGAGAAYGEEALKVATTVKLTRALWIIPLSLVSALIFRQKGKKIQIPWFIFWFVVAMLVNTYCNLPTQLTHGISVAARCGLSATLFLIGGGLSIEVIRKVGLKPLVLGIILWAVISVASLAVKSKAANGDFRLRRIDFQHDASGLPAKSLQYPAAHIGTAQVGRNGQMLDIDIFRSRPVIKNAYQPAVRPDAVGRIVRIGKSLQMVFQRTDLLLGERVLIDRPRLVPTRVGRRSERSEFQIGFHR